MWWFFIRKHRMGLSRPTQRANHSQNDYVVGRCKRGWWEGASNSRVEDEAAAPVAPDAPSHILCMQHTRAKASEITPVRGTAGQTIPPHLMNGLRRSYIHDKMTYQVFGSVDVCVGTNPLWILPPYIKVCTCDHHICNVTDIFRNGNPLNTPKKWTF